MMYRTFPKTEGASSEDTRTIDDPRNEKPSPNPSRACWLASSPEDLGILAIARSPSAVNRISSEEHGGLSLSLSPSLLTHP